MQIRLLAALAALFIGCALALELDSPHVQLQWALIGLVPIMVFATTLAVAKRAQ